MKNYDHHGHSHTNLRHHHEYRSYGGGQGHDQKSWKESARLALPIGYFKQESLADYIFGTIAKGIAKFKHG